MATPRKKTVKPVEAVTEIDTTTNTEEPSNPVREAYKASEGNIRHIPYAVKLQSGLYFKTVHLIEDLQTIYPECEVSTTKTAKKGYAIKVENKIKDYILDIK